MSDYNIPVSGGVNGLNVPLHGHIAVYNKEFPVIPNPEGEVTGYVTKLGFTPEILQVKDPEVHDWARAEEKPTYTKAEVGLGNVDNTSDLNKPISTATQTALDGKVDKVPGKALSTNDYSDTDKAIVDGITSALATKVDKIAGKGLSSNDYTDYEKTKLAYIQSGAEVNVQVDWFESNRWSDAFILNKPTKLSDFSNDTGFITSTVDNLTYYYKKSETYTQAEVNALIGSIVTISFLVVQELPTTGEANIIYLVPAEDPNPDNIYEEYIYVNDDWELIGTTKVDLSDYYTKSETYSKSETDTLLSAKANTLDLSTVATSGSYADLSNTPVIDTAISPTSTNAVQNKVVYDLFNSLLPGTTVTGNPITITDAGGLNAKSLKIKLLPIQDTTGGEPSPANPCPIYGRTQTTVSVNNEDTIISLGQTIYGGEVKSDGKTDINITTVDLGTLIWTYLSNWNGHPVFYTNDISNLVKKPVTQSDAANSLCTIYKNMSRNDLYDLNDYGMAFNPSGTLNIRDSRYSTPETFKTAMSGIILYYETVSKTEVDTPVFDISLSRGNNTIMAEGNMELVYIKVQ